MNFYTQLLKSITFHKILRHSDERARLARRLNSALCTGSLSPPRAACLMMACTRELGLKPVAPAVALVYARELVAAVNN